MKLLAFAASILAAATVFGQQPAAPAAESVAVAVINGEILTAAKLDALYNNIPPGVRAQYETTGGKKAFLDNYIAKRLMIQEAMKRGFDQRADIQEAMEAARESALFDRYIREVVAADIVPEAASREFYEQNLDKFQEGETAKVRHIVVSWNNRSRSAAREMIERIFAEAQTYRVTYPPDSLGNRQIFSLRFAELARKYSEDGVAQSGGDLGWVARGQLDKAFEDVAFNMPAGVMSGIVSTNFGYHLILVDDKKPAGPRPYEDVRREIREYLFGQKQSEIMAAVTRLTNELRRTSKVAVYTDKVD